MSGANAIVASSATFACNCIGPQNGEPLCPCQMRNVIVRDGRYVRVERDLGPVVPQRGVGIPAHGCICPAGAERTCFGQLCPRRPMVSM